MSSRTSTEFDTDDVIDVGEIIETLDIITNDTRSVCEMFQNNNKERQNNIITGLEGVTRIKEQISLFRKIKKEMVDMAQNNLSENTKYMNKLTEELQKLKEGEKQEVQDVNEQKLKQSKLKSQREILDVKKRKTDDLRNTILAFKLLTRTDFLYKTKNVEGYVTLDEDFVTFNMNPSTLSKKEITDNIWEILRKGETKRL